MERPFRTGPPLRQGFGGASTIETFVNLGYYDPDLQLTSTGEIQLQKNLASTDGTNKLTDLDSHLKNLENSASSEAQMNDKLAHLSDDVDFLKGQVLGASMSAALQNSQSILSDGQTATLSALMVTGNTNLYDLGVVGNFNVGTINIDGLSGSLNSIGQDLKIQSDKIAGVSFEGGAITIDTSGNISLKEGRIIGNDNIRGIDVPIASGQGNIQITFKDPRPSSSYAVSISPSWLTQFAVTNKTANGFTIEFSQEPAVDSSLDWLVID